MEILKNETFDNYIFRIVFKYILRTILSQSDYSLLCIKKVGEKWGEICRLSSDFPAASIPVIPRL